MASLDNLLGDLEELAIAAAPKAVEEEKQPEVAAATSHSASRPIPKIVPRTAPTFVKKKKAPVKKDDDEDDFAKEDVNDLLAQLDGLSLEKKKEKEKEEEKPAPAAPAPAPAPAPVRKPAAPKAPAPAPKAPAAPAPAPKPAAPRAPVAPAAPAPAPKPIGTCGLCKKGIMATEASLEIKGQKYHKACFKCADCGAALQSYVPHDGKFYCMGCVKKHQGNAATLTSGKCCAVCGKPIDPTTLQAGDKYYHRACFKCAHCGKPIAGTYGEVNGKVYCSNECIREATGVRCNGCGKVITGQYINVLNKPYHKDCLACKKCHKPFPDLKFYNVNGDPYCADCATQALSNQ